MAIRPVKIPAKVHMYLEYEASAEMFPDLIWSLYEIAI